MAVIGAEDRQADTVTVSPWRLRNNTLLCIVAACIPVALYLLFVTHFWSDVPNADDWSAVWLVSAALARHIPWHAMWAQHLDNRTFVPNVGFILVGGASHESMKVQMIVNGLVFIAAFGGFLALFRRYAPAAFRPVPVFFLGLVWFSLADLSSGVWAFQLTWYLIVAMLIAVLWLLLARRLTWTALAMAIVCAAAASYSSSQGLILWPIGFVGILWAQPWRPSLWTRATARMATAWVGAGVVTTIFYFVGYQSVAPNPGNLFPSELLGVNFSSASTTYVTHHLGEGIQFFLVLLGNVVSLGPMWFRGVVGAALLVSSVYVIVRCTQRRRGEGAIGYLPAALIAFGLLVDVLTVVGRVRYGVHYAVTSRYTMFNLLLLVGLGVFAIRYLYLVEQRSKVRIVAGLAMALAIAQMATSTVGGVSGVSAERATLHMEGRLVVTTDLVPNAEQFCYRVNSLFRYMTPGLSPSDVAQMKRQQLTIFAPGPYNYYRSQGLPIMPTCLKPSSTPSPR